MIGECRPKTSNAANTAGANLEVSARVVRLEMLLAKQQQALDSSSRQVR